METRGFVLPFRGLFHSRYKQGLPCNEEDQTTGAQSRRVRLLAEYSDFLAKEE